MARISIAKELYCTRIHWAHRRFQLGYKNNKQWPQSRNVKTPFGKLKMRPRRNFTGNHQRFGKRFKFNMPINPNQPILLFKDISNANNEILNEDI